jgi:hypothetical protein
MFQGKVSSLFQCALVVCFLVGLSPARADTGRPVAVIENSAYDFGEVYERTDIIADFIIKNIGDADLEIQTVKTKK